MKHQKQNDPAQVYLDGVITPAMTYFPAMQYHRRLGLNYCVRDGNRCDTKALITDKQPTASFDDVDADSRNQKVKPGAEAPAQTRRTTNPRPRPWERVRSFRIEHAFEEERMMNTNSERART